MCAFFVAAASFAYCSVAFSYSAVLCFALLCLLFRSEGFIFFALLVLCRVAVCMGLIWFGLDQRTPGTEGWDQRMRVASAAWEEANLNRLCVLFFLTNGSVDDSPPPPLGDRDVCLVGENPTYSIPAL